MRLPPRLVSLFLAFHGAEFRIKSGAIRTNDQPTPRVLLFATLMPHNVLHTQHVAGPGRMYTSAAFVHRPRGIRQAIAFVLERALLLAGVVYRVTSEERGVLS